MQELEDVAVQFDLRDNLDTDTDIESEVTRWSRLFNLTTEQARQELTAFRSTGSDVVVSNELWDIVKGDASASGHNRESYTFSLSTTKHLPKAHQSQATAAHDPLAVYGKYAIQLRRGAPLSSAEQIQQVLQLSYIPQTYEGSDEDGTMAVFCVLPALVKVRLLEYLRAQSPSFVPVVARITKAEKCLSASSRQPCLGIDTTLPQHRSVVHAVPRQDEFPVWYIFYGRLAEAELLKGLLELDEEPEYRSASVQGGNMCRLGGKYNALVNGEGIVQGHAFLVEDEEQEEKLRFFETDMYEVVRCEIRFEDGTGGRVPGLCF